MTVFENNFSDGISNTYQATLVYLIRKKDRQDIYSEVQNLGLFSVNTWKSLLNERGFKISKYQQKNIYDNFITENGRYTRQIFNGIKR